MNALPSESGWRGWIGRQPLRRKLQIKSNFIAVVAALVVSTIFAVHRLVSLRADQLSDTLAITRMVAENSTGPAAFQDSLAATAALASLRAKDSIVGAVIDLPRQRNFAVFRIPPTVAERLPDGVSFRFRGWILQTAAPIGDDENVRPTLQIISDLRPELWATLRAVFVSLASSVALAIALSHFASNQLRRFILRPIENLHAATQRVGVHVDYSYRAEVVSSDELGELTDAFNRMLDRLQSTDSELRAINDSLKLEIAERHRLERALVDTSRQAGMAEVATGILHNVGNVLNSVNISTQLMRESLDRSQLFNLNRAADLIQSKGDEFVRFVADDPAGKVLPHFVVTVATALTKEHKAASDELGQLAKNIEHIKEIISAQQGFAKMVGLTERLAPRDLFDEAERIAQASVLRHGVEIVHEYTEAPLIIVDRHRALQILVNFITNAIHAVKANAHGRRRIILRMAAHSGGVIFGVVDNGVGIPAANLKRVFNHGFTTRRDGHGFGLHSGALAARLLGGELRAESAGAGQGASFTLDLPLDCPPKPNEVALA